MSIKRIKTSYPGVFYREAQRIAGSGVEKVYYIIFKKNARVFEEKVGRQYADNMTAAKANRIRNDRIEGRRESRKEIRSRLEMQQISLDRIWTFDKLWKEYKRVKTLKGILYDENRYDKHLRNPFGLMKPTDLKPPDVDSFRMKLQLKYKPATVRNILELLKRLINFAVSRDLCEVPRFKIELPVVNNIRTEDLEPDQIRNLIKVIEESPNRDAANMMKLALFTGMRRGEMFRLRWSDVDRARKFIKLRDPKSGQDQKIPLNEAALRVFETQPQNSEYIFPGRGGKMRKDISQQLNKIKVKAGLPKDFRPLHGLRHTFASMLASSGKVDMYTLQKLLTHKSPIMTQRYAHLRDDALKKASDLVVDIINSAKKE